MELGKRIVKIRKDNKLNQDDFAEKYYVTRQTISNWENEKSYPDLETLVKISNDFNILLDTLLKEDDRMIKDISKKQKNYKFIKILINMLNIAGLAVLVYFAIPYVFHIESLNAYSYRTCGFIILLGFKAFISSILNSSFLIIFKSAPNSKQYCTILYVKLS